MTKPPELPGVTSVVMNGTLDTSLGMQADTLNSVGMLFGLYFRREGIFDFQSYFEGYQPTSI
jgi:hypothetical protein